MKLTKSMSSDLKQAGEFGIKIPKSLAKDLKIVSSSSESKVNEIVAKLAAAAEAEKSKETIAGILSAIKDLEEYRESTIEAFKRVDFILNNPYEYDVEIVRGDDGLAERFIMRPRNARVIN